MGDGYKEFEVGEVLGAADVMGYLMKQSIMAFASGAALIAGVTSPEEGMVGYIADADAFWYYHGEGWRPIITGGVWFPYTPAWTSAGTPPSLGNGVATGRYMRQGQTIFFHAEIVTGSTSSYGSGAYDLSLPIAARITSPTQYVQTRVSDSSAGQAYAGQSGALAEMSVRLQIQGASNLDNVSQGTPVTLAAGDALHAWGTYEAALT